MEKSQESSSADNSNIVPFPKPEPLLALVMIVRNEEAIIEKALASIMERTFDEIVVLDQNSTDQTVEVIKQVCKKRSWTTSGSTKFSLYQYKGDVVGLPEYHYFRAFEKTTSTYIMVLDADEELTPEFQQQVRNVLKSKELDGALLARLNFVFDKLGRDVYGGHITCGHHRYYEPIFRLYKRDSIDWENPPGLHRTVQLKPSNLNVAQFSLPCIVHTKSAERQLEQMERYAKLDPNQPAIWQETNSTIKSFLKTYGWEGDLILAEREKRKQTSEGVVE